MDKQLISLATMRPIVIPVCQIGQVVKYHGDMANPGGIGAIIAIEPNKYGYSPYTVALVDGRQIKQAGLECKHRWTLTDEVCIDGIEALKAGVSAKTALDAANASAAKESFAAALIRVKADNPYLIPIKAGDCGCVLAAKNLRIELKKAFPAVKFSVRTSKYSGGDSIDVSWTDGPATKQVEQIADKYQGGSFDGMTDCYNYSRSPWTEVFGDSKYVFCRRDYSDAMIEGCIRRTVARLGGMDSVPTVADFRSGNVWNFKQSGGCDVSRELNQALAKHTYCL